MSYLPEFDPRKGLYIYSHLMGSPATSAGDPAFGSVNGAGAGTGALTTTATNRPGIWRTTTGTATTGRAAISSGVGAIALGGGPLDVTLDVKIPVLSTVAERYQFVVGLFDTVTAANQVDACAFVYDEGGVSTNSAASANWQQLTAANSVRTWTTTGTAVPVDTWQRLMISVNADASSVGFFINGAASGAAHTLTIPSGTARTLAFGWLIIKSAGGTARDADLDFFELAQTFSTPS